ncbi:hypothetical protein [Acinetobacter phage AB1I1M-1]
MVNGFAVYYKDKDGFELPLTEYGVFSIYHTELKAKEFMQESADKISEILHPTKKFKATRNMFGAKKVEEIKPPVLPQYARDELIRQLKTLFVKKVTVA